jgi:hemerythrin
MNMVNWSSDMRLGVARIDTAHESFLRALTMVAEAGDDHFCDAFCGLVRRVEHDFLEEEAMMEEIDFPGLHSHREQHARVLGTLHQVAGHVMQGDIGTGRTAVALLPQWFMLHLSTMDTALALALELCECEAAAVPVPPAQ